MSSPDYVPTDAENVLDHGGTLGESVSRSTAEANSQAVEDAANASSGNNVYIPEGTLKYGAQYSAAAILFDGNAGAAGTSVYGASPTKSFLLCHESHNDGEQPEIWYNGSVDHGDITWQGLTLDGNQSLNSFAQLSGRQRGLNFREGASAGTIQFTNFRMRHMVYAGTSFGPKWPDWDGTVQSCTFYDIAIGLLKQSSGDAIDHVFSGVSMMPSGHKLTVVDSEFRLVSGSVVDTGGTGTVEFNNCFMKGIGDSVCKSGNNLGRLVLRHVAHEGMSSELDDANSNVNTQFRGRHLCQRQNPGSGDQRIELSHVKSSRLTSTFIFNGGGSWNIETHSDGGPVHVEDVANAPDAEFAYFAAFRASGGDDEFNLDKFSVHNINNDIFALDTGTGTISTLHRESGTVIGDPDGVSISTDNESGAPFSPDVPAQSEVGISATSDSTDDTSDPTAPVFDEWTPRWNSTQDNWSVVSDSAYAGGSALVFEHSTDELDLYGISWDAAGEHSDVEVLDRFRVPAFNPESGLGFHARVHLRSSTVNGTRQGYWIEVEDRENAFRLGRYTSDGDLTTLGHFGTPEEGTFYNRRFRANGNQIKAKVWPAAETEPDGWDIEVTDDAVSSGWVGLGSYDPGRVETDIFSVATGGDTAQFVHSDSAPSAAWASPTDDTVLSGNVPVRIDASDVEDTDDTLLVEYQVDGGSWAAASYNPDTGYYEDTWDSTAVTDGDHTLTASVTDSAGNTSETVVTVTTDNSGTRPTVEGLSLSEVETTTADAEFDAAWQVGDANGNLETVDLVLVQADGTTEDTATVSVSGGTASGTTRLIAPDDDGSGVDYTVELTATDSKANTATDTASTTEFEDTGSAPTVSRFSVSEAGRPDPHAEITAVWDVSDADGDLAGVDIDVADSTGTVQSVNWSLYGSTASDTDTFRLKGGDSETFEVTLTVTDSAGQTATATRTLTA
jgi:hypothetical protein